MALFATIGPKSHRKIFYGFKILGGIAIINSLKIIKEANRVERYLSKRTILKNLILNDKFFLEK
jgi:hypothetical protein